MMDPTVCSGNWRVPPPRCEMLQSLGFISFSEHEASFRLSGPSSMLSTSQYGRGPSEIRLTGVTPLGLHGPLSWPFLWGDANAGVSKDSHRRESLAIVGFVSGMDREQEVCRGCTTSNGTLPKKVGAPRASYTQERRHLGPLLYGTCRSLGRHWGLELPQAKSFRHVYGINGRPPIPPEPPCGTA